jgi:hypothetical protein
MKTFNRPLEHVVKQISGVEPPSIAPLLTTLTNGASTLKKGTYYVAYTWCTVMGETTRSPIASIPNVPIGKNLVVTVPTFPTNVISACIYISMHPDELIRQGMTATKVYEQSVAVSGDESPPLINTAHEWALPVEIVGQVQGVPQSVKIDDSSIYLPVEIRGLNREFLFTTASNLGISGVYISPIYDFINHKAITGIVSPSHAGTLYIQESDDQVAWYNVNTIALADQVSATINAVVYYNTNLFNQQIASRYVRLVFVNGAVAAQTRFILSAYATTL